MGFIKHAIYAIDLFTAFYVVFQLVFCYTANLAGRTDTAVTVDFNWWVTLFVTRIFIVIIQNEYNKNK
jgi:hypothetical protein